MGHRGDPLRDLILSALARHGPLGVDLIASYVEVDRTSAETAVEKLRRDGRVEVTTGKKTKRYRIKEATSGA